MGNLENIHLPWPDWEIVKYLGGGAYGKVYEIERTISGTQEKEKAALKIVSRPKYKDEIESYYNEGYSKAELIAFYESEIQNYVQEYKLMKELQGESNIVSWDDFTMVPHEDGIGGDIFIRMELLTSLQQRMRERSLSEQEIIKLGKDISHALVLFESKNIIHRDIKPTNIMVSQFGNYKLGDFGVSKIMDHATYATAMGMPEYQAPEVVYMEKYGQTADIYSLGITLYWLLNNRRMPFIGADEQLTPRRIVEATNRRYNGERIPTPKNGSEKLKQIVLKACEYRPEDRYLSALMLYEALEVLEDKAHSEDFEKIHLPWQDWKIVRDLGGGRKEKVYEIKRCGKESPFVIPDQVNKAALKIISIPDDENEIKWRFEGCDEKSIIAHYEDEIQKYEQKYERIKQLEDDSNIVNCYEVAVVPHENGIGGDIFIQMEFIEKSLQDVMKKGNLSIEDIIELGKDISRALLVCETWEISHCGIRPENIVRSQSGDWKLRDYTVGVFYDPLICYNMAGSVYWSPEHGCGKKADIYALGIVMYELLNQQSMHFMGMSYMENLPAPKRGSEELKQIVLKACAYKPEDRYASVQELYDALDAVDVPEVPINGEHFSNRAEEAERLLSKIEVEKLTAKNVIRTIIRGIIAWGIGIAVFMAGVSIESGWIMIIGLFVHFGALYRILSRMGAADFSEWMKTNKEKIKDIDQYIRTNPEFARRLYYEKCRKKYLLEYMNRLNPNVVKSIKESKRIRK